MPSLATEAGGWIRCRYCDDGRRWLPLKVLLSGNAPKYCSARCRAAALMRPGDIQDEAQRRQRETPTACDGCGETTIGVHQVGAQIRVGRLVGGHLLCRGCRHVLLRSCAKKIRFDTEVAARDKLVELTTAARPVDLDTAHAYPCRVCSGWHVSSHRLDEGTTAVEMADRAALLAARIEAGLFGWDPMMSHRQPAEETRP